MSDERVVVPHKTFINSYENVVRGVEKRQLVEGDITHKFHPHRLVDGWVLEWMGGLVGGLVNGGVRSMEKRQLVECRSSLFCVFRFAFCVFFRPGLATAIHIR